MKFKEDKLEQAFTELLEQQRNHHYLDESPIVRNPVLLTDDVELV